MADAAHDDGKDFTDDDSLGDASEDTPLVSRGGAATKFDSPDFTLPRLALLCSFSVGWSALWSFLMLIALPRCVVDIVGEGRKGHYLGILMLSGGVVSVVEPPAIGFISDRTRTRCGRRFPYVVCGAVASSMCTLLIPYCTTMPELILVYVFTQLTSNASSSAFLGLLPDLVDESQLGRASGIMAGMAALGQLIGSSMGLCVRSMHLPAVCAFVATLHVAGMVITVACNPEDPSLGFARDDEMASAGAASCWHHFMSPLASHDFRWVVLTRFFYNMAIYSVTEFLQYYVAEMIPVKGWDATREVAYLFVPLLLSALVSATLAGVLSDRWGKRRKIFVYASGYTQTLICIAFAFNRDFTTAMGLSVAFGLAFGVFSAIDFAMVCDVLPTRSTAAKDLGIWHVSLVVPQVLATPLSGQLLDSLRDSKGPRAGYEVIFLLAAGWFFLGTVLVSRVRGVA